MASATRIGAKTKSHWIEKMGQPEWDAIASHTFDEFYVLLFRRVIVQNRNASYWNSDGDKYFAIITFLGPFINTNEWEKEERI